MPGPQKVDEEKKKRLDEKSNSILRSKANAVKEKEDVKSKNKQPKRPAVDNPSKDLPISVDQSSHLNTEIQNAESKEQTIRKQLISTQEHHENPDKNTKLAVEKKTKKTFSNSHANQKLIEDKSEDILFSKLEAKKHGPEGHILPKWLQKEEITAKVDTGLHRPLWKILKHRKSTPKSLVRKAKVESSPKSLLPKTKATSSPKFVSKTLAEPEIDASIKTSQRIEESHPIKNPTLRKQFLIPSKDPYDVYKQNSGEVINTLCQYPTFKKMRGKDINIVHQIAIEHDLCLPLDLTENSPETPHISQESQEQMKRLPSWLQPMITNNFHYIHSHFGRHTHSFLRMIANRIDLDRSIQMKLLNDDDKQQDIDKEEAIGIEKYFGQSGRSAKAMTIGKGVSMNEDAISTSSQLFKIARAVGTWKKQKIGDEWNPAVIHRTMTELRAAMLTESGGSDAPIVLEAQQASKIEDETEDLRAFISRPHWEDILIDEKGYKEKIARMVSKDLKENFTISPAKIKRERSIGTTAPQLATEIKLRPTKVRKKHGTEKKKEDSHVKFKSMDNEASNMNLSHFATLKETKKNEANNEEQQGLLVQQDVKNVRKKQYTDLSEGIMRSVPEDELDLHESEGENYENKNNPDCFGMEARKARKKKKMNLMDHGAFRDETQTWWKNCPLREIDDPFRLPHHYRVDESFHAFCVMVVSTEAFKQLVMTVILINSIFLAFETDRDPIGQLIYQMFDDFFLSIYTIEFAIKVYAFPYLYWKSGFNIFDFVVLVISLAKSTVDWINIADISFLRILVIIRAVRILRSLSLSVQMQVLITALLETMKTHVLSVVLLLFLLMYIAAILAYYLFGLDPELEGSWGSIGFGMIKLFSFVTSDSWTGILEEFECTNRIHQGRIFCLMGIVFGNFVYSNIFIAIIIMQISEATEDFQAKQAEIREEIISRKKDAVFRRQKLDMRQLLAKQSLSRNSDFYHLGAQFQKLLRHRDLVEMNGICFSPIWMDCLYQTNERLQAVANVIMNLHRQLADNFVELMRLKEEERFKVQKIRRARYNRWMRLKAKMTVIKEELYKQATPLSRPRLRIRLGKKSRIK